VTRRGHRGTQLLETLPLCRVGGYAEQTTDSTGIGGASPNLHSVAVASVLIQGPRSARHNLGVLQVVQESQ
jgi:hypothetical protein